MREDILARGEDPSSFPILNSKPELFRDLVWIWEAYMVLSTSRQNGMSGPQPISISDIHSFMLIQDVNDMEDRELLLHHVQHMDNVFRADHIARNPPKTSGGGRR